MIPLEGILAPATCRPRDAPARRDCLDHLYHGAGTSHGLLQKSPMDSLYKDAIGASRTQLGWVSGSLIGPRRRRIVQARIRPTTAEPDATRKLVLMPLASPAVVPG